MVICKKCNGQGILYIGLTEDELYWNTADCNECGGTGEADKEHPIDAS